MIVCGKNKTKLLLACFAYLGRDDTVFAVTPHLFVPIKHQPQEAGATWKGGGEARVMEYET